MSDPLITIIMSTYNRSGLIGESIQSVLAQSYKNWELIVVDDGSTDDTEDKVRTFKDARIQYFHVAHSGFLGKVKNIGLKKARGELIAFHDSDDLWRNDKLAFQVELLRRYPQAFFVLSNGDQFGEFATSTPDYKRLFVGQLFLPVLERAEFCFYCPSMIFKKSVIDDIGTLDESIPFMRELHFFLRMSQKYDGIFTNERLISIRKHTGNYSNSFLVNAHLNSLKMYEEFRDTGALTSRQFCLLASKCYYRIGLFYLGKQDVDSAIVNFSACTRLDPLNLKGWIRYFGLRFRILLDKAAATP